jgi:hypothetical protein
MLRLSNTSLQYRLDYYTGIKPAYSMQEMVDGAVSAVLNMNDDKIKAFKQASVFCGESSLSSTGKTTRPKFEQMIVVQLASFDTSYNRLNEDERLDVSQYFSFVLVPDLNCLAVHTPDMGLGEYRVISCLDVYTLLQEQRGAWIDLREAIRWLKSFL